jgi:asparagine synthase (glutamine-hydrolysing)
MPEGYSGEISHARRWVEYCRRDMTHLDVRYVTTEGDDLLAGLEQDFLDLDGSLGAAAIATKAMCRSIADRGAGVLLDGNGGDYTVNVTARGFVFELLRRGRLLSAMRELAGFRRTRNLTWPQAISREAASHVLATLRERLRPRGEFRSHLPFTPRYRAALRAGAGRFAPRVREAARSGWGQRLASLQGMQRQAEPRWRGIATRYGLDLARPFLDKRMIEFALAIPLSLVARDGLDRFLARKALGDLYPREFGSRVRKGRDSDVPDIMALIRQARPQFMDGIARMEKSERLRKLYDFDRIRELLEKPSSEPRTRLGVTAFMSARYIEWFERGNRFEPECEAKKPTVSAES